MEQQITAMASQTEAENSPSITIDTPMLTEQKAVTNPSCVQCADTEFSSNYKHPAVSQASTHLVRSQQVGHDGHLCRPTSCSIDPTSGHCGYRPVICWFGYVPNSEPFNMLPLGSSPGHFDGAPNFFGSFPFSTLQYSNSLCPWLLGGQQHNFYAPHVAEPYQDLRQSLSLIHSGQAPFNSDAGLQTSVPLQQFKCGLSGCGRHFKRQNALNRHVASHSGERPYICWVPGCQRSFSRRDNLNTHHKTHGKRGGRNRYVATLDKTGPVYNPEF